jgi:hypothetical protein
VKKNKTVILIEIGANLNPSTLKHEEIASTKNQFGSFGWTMRQKKGGLHRHCGFYPVCRCAGVPIRRFAGSGHFA